MERDQNLSLSDSFTKFAAVVLDAPTPHPLEYGIPEGKIDFVKIGVRVQVPLRGSLREGIVVEVKETATYSKPLAIHKILSEEHPFTDDLFELALWMSKYYFCPLRYVLKNIWPQSIRDSAPKLQYFVKLSKSKEEIRSFLTDAKKVSSQQRALLEILLLEKKGLFLTELLEKANLSKSPLSSLEKKGWVSIEKVALDRSPLQGEEYFKTSPKKLSDEQACALSRILETLSKREFQTHLLFGITGSGKTEVYLQGIEKALSLQLGTIMLVPEISLTTQTIERFKARFETQIAILHHRLSKGERYDEWQKIRKGEAKIVVGARSALFSPVQNLGLIIVDEEHDTAYKQAQDFLCYHARDVAVMRGKISKAAVVLGTATPSIESYFNAERGKYVLSTLLQRPTRFGLPKVTLVDMKKEYDKAKGPISFSENLIEGIKKRLQVGEQTILFLNRRGFHTTLLCGRCSFVFKCPHCDLPYTFHLKEKKLACHLCGFQIPPPSACVTCGHKEMLKYRGVGTEHIEKTLHTFFPTIRTLRVDADTTRHKGSHDKLLRAFSTQKADVLIGTQMIAKGLHFPSVTLVAILNCDGALQIPDFRASERVFQLITQVAGRSGRGELPGEVIIQTKMPDNQTIEFASNQDFESFYKNEIEIRKLFDFPPFCHFVKLSFFGKEEEKVQSFANRFREKLLEKFESRAMVHPVNKAGYPKIKDDFYFQCLLRGKNVYFMHQILEKVLEENPIPKSVKFRIDVDPLSTFF